VNGKRKVTRIKSKIDELPEELRDQVNNMIIDVNYTYTEISNFLAQKGYDVSRSSIGRYALRKNAVVQRFREAQEQTKILVDAVKNNPEGDYTEATMQMLMTRLTEKIAVAEEEFENLDMGEAGRLIVALSRTKAYKDRVRQEMRKKVDLAFEKMESEILKVIKGAPELAADLRAVLEKAKARMIEDD
jgi:predicted transcriptional regulator